MISGAVVSVHQYMPVRDLNDPASISSPTSLGVKQGWQQ